MKDANMKVQFLACEYMERTYGKNWSKRLKVSLPSIINAFIDGYSTKGNEEKTATVMLYSRNLVDKLEPQRESIEKIFKLKVEVKEYMPDNIIALCDDDLNVLTLIDLNKK